MMKYTSIQQIISDNKRAGFHFFDDSTMRFFGSRVLSGLYGDGTVFITSERYIGTMGERDKRYYTVRQIDGQFNIQTIGEFQQWGSAYYARKAAKEYAKELA